uniref:Uncharacterized protein n=1 Tax=Salix viminalis TaxID=40686 RepID=A0A6N2K358_SALVM
MLCRQKRRLGWTIQRPQAFFVWNCRFSGHLLLLLSSLQKQGRVHCSCTQSQGTGRWYCWHVFLACCGCHCWVLECIADDPDMGSCNTYADTNSSRKKNY